MQVALKHHIIYLLNGAGGEGRTRNLKLGQLAGKTLLDKDGKTLSELKYFYSPSGKIISRLANGKLQEYKYDAKNQLLAVIDMESKSAVEEYVYDASGNILKKTINGKTTTYTYDDANQLLSSTNPEGDITSYAYDAAGRLVKEGEKTYEYGWLDKVMRVAEDGKELARFEYHNNNQLAKAIRKNGVETFEWDGLALIERNGTKYINEPHAIGGESAEAIFTDILGTSLGKVDKNGYSAIDKTSFGADSSDNSSFFTGKPYIEDLGYAFLLRNYRADMGKWLSQDLIGYPDGWNNFAYCCNQSTCTIDLYGAYDLANSAYISIKLQNGTVKEGYISSSQDVTNMLNNASSSNKITDFTYTGHGASDGAGLIVNSQSGYYIPARDFGNLSSNFAEGVNITLNACYQGNYLSEYLSGVDVSANITGFTGELIPIGPLSWETVFRDPRKFFKGTWKTLSE